MNALLDLEALTNDRTLGEDAVLLLAGASGHIAASPTGGVHAVRALFRVLRAGGERAEVFAGDGAPAPEPAHPEPHEREVVQIFANVERVTVSRDTPAQVRVLVRVAPGWHIAAADATGLVPLRVGIINGAGVAAYADYPAGEEFGPANARKTSVLRGDFDLPIALELTGDWRGKPLLAITYQACSDTECLAPATVELDIAIDRG